MKNGCKLKRPRLISLLRFMTEMVHSFSPLHSKCLPTLSKSNLIGQQLIQKTMVLRKLQREDKFLNQQVKQSTSVDYRIMMKFQMILLKITGSFKIFMIYKNKIKTKPLSSLAYQRPRKFVIIRLSMSLELLSITYYNLRYVYISSNRM